MVEVWNKIDNNYLIKINFWETLDKSEGLVLVTLNLFTSICYISFNFQANTSILTVSHFAWLMINNLLGNQTLLYLFFSSCKILIGPVANAYKICLKILCVLVLHINHFRLFFSEIFHKKPWMSFVKNYFWEKRTSFDYFNKVLFKTTLLWCRMTCKRRKPKTRAKSHCTRNKKIAKKIQNSKKKKKKKKRQLRLTCLAALKATNWRRHLHCHKELLQRNQNRLWPVNRGPQEWCQVNKDLHLNHLEWCHITHPHLVSHQWWDFLQGMTAICIFDLFQ